MSGIGAEGGFMSASAAMADVFRPSEKKLGALYDVVLVFGGSLLIGLCAQVAVGWPVPITGQTFAVLMIGVLFGAKHGSITVLLYILEGAARLPVFAQGKAGAGVLAGPTGGYLVGFVAAAFVVGLLGQRGWDRRFWTTVAAMAVGNIIIYAFGLVWLSLLVGVERAFAVGLYPFLLGDAIKIVLAAMLLPLGWKLLNRFG